MTIRGKVTGGVIVLDPPHALPEGTQVSVEPLGPEPKAAEQEDLTTKLLRWAGCVKGMPADWAENHDHYIHGRPKK